jgi:3',5'-cyclic AMP phosphodiesterase CpdA
MNLLAISDLHVGYEANRAGIDAMVARPDDWLILAGDIGESADHLRWTFERLGPRFAQLLWVPGNHELWTLPNQPEVRGAAKYQDLVEVCRQHGVLTPEDPWVVWPGDGATVIALLFLGYDYSFGPDEMSAREAVAWAAEDGVRCTDESYLHPDPFPSREAWCATRLADAERRLTAVPDHQRIVLVNHFPLRRDLVRLFRIPRFIPWCGTRRTEDWHRRFPIDVVVSGHLHMRATDWRDGVRFEEVSLGYPRHWRAEHTVDGYVRRILPSPCATDAVDGPVWHR